MKASLAFLAIITFLLSATLKASAIVAEDAPIFEKFKLKTFIFFVHQVAIDSQAKHCIADLKSDYRNASRDCNNATRELKKVIDLYAEPPLSILVFKTELLSLLQQQNTLNFLGDLVTALKRNEITDLWAWIKAHKIANGSEQSTLKLSALLFQDLYEMGFLRLIDDPKEPANQITQECVNILFSIRNILYPIQSVPSRLGLNSESIEPTKLYHFYVIAYLSYKMSQSLKTSAVSAAIPYLFNRSYEFATIRMREGNFYNANASIDLSSAGGIKNILYPPNAKSNNLAANFASDFEGDALHDIYLGYRAAIFGAELAHRELSHKALNRTEFEQNFRLNPSETTKLLLLKKSH